MRSMRPCVAWLTGALAAAAIAVPTATAQQVDPYPATLYFGTGLITIPVAWVSPNNSDVWVQLGNKQISWAPGQNFATRFNQNLSTEVHFLGRFSTGISVYTQDPQWGLFGQLQLLNQQPATWLPGVAVGVRNVGPYSHEDRFLDGGTVQLVGSQYQNVTPSFYQNFHTTPTVYGVATKDFAFGGGEGRVPSSAFGLSVGYGSGIFHDDGGQGKAYNDKGTIVKGLFLGARYAFHPSLNSTVHLLAENDGWDYNAGLVYDYRGITAGVYETELEEGGLGSDYRIYNYRKFNFALGYNGNVIDISRGVILRAKITDLTREQQRLQLEIKQRERRIRGLETALRKAQAGELADIEQRRRALEQEVQSERDAIQRANERLQQLQNGQQPTAPTPSTSPTMPTTPPSSTPTTPPSSSPTTPPGSTGTPSTSTPSTPPAVQ